MQIVKTGNIRWLRLLGMLVLALSLTLVLLWALMPQTAVGQADEPHIRLEKNPTYYDAASVAITEVTSLFSDQEKAWKRYQGGDFDTITPPFSALDEIKASPVYSPQHHAFPNAVTVSYFFSNDVPPFDNPLVRAAFASAIDRPRLIDEALSGDELPALTFTPPGNFGHVDGYANDVGRPYSPTLAATLLAASGYTGDPPIVLAYRELPDAQALGESVRQMWIETLGVTVTLEPVPRQDYWDLLRDGSVEERPGVFWSGWGADYPDANHWFRDAGNWYFGLARYNSPALTALVDAAAGEPDPAARLDLYKQAETQLTMNDTAMAPLYYWVNYRLTRPDLDRTYRSFGGQHLDEWAFSGDPRPLALAWGEPETLDPAFVWPWGANVEYVNQLFVGLTDYDENGNVVPELATAWEASPDAQVYTFTLRSDAKWSDGRDVTAHDVEYGVLRTLAPDTGSEAAYYLYIIENAEAYHNGDIDDPALVGMEALDDTHVRFTLTEPAAYFPAIVALPPARPQPRWAIDAHGDAWTEPENIVSNGPYLLAAWRKSPPDLRIAVNYAHDWISAETDPHTTVTLTLKNQVGDIYVVVGETNDDGWFNSSEGQWDPQYPSISPGDAVTATIDGATTAVNPVGEITGIVDADADTVAGTIHAPWFAPETLTVRCEIWIENGPEPIEVRDVAADGGAYLCDFTGQWDIPPGGEVSVIYSEPDGDEVINVLSAPWMRINYAHDWVGGNYPAGRTFDITVSDSVGSIKATAQIESTPDGGWGGEGFETREEDWVPMQPDIEPGDRVRLLSDDGYDNTIEVGVINGALDIDADSVGGTILAPWFSEMLDIECHPWGGPEEAGVKNSTAAPDGSAPYFCQWDAASEWDILPGQNVAVMYVEPDGDRVINVFQETAPDGGVEKWIEGSGEVMPGGPVVFTIRYRNDGEAVAETLTLTDTLPAGTTYVSDTSGVLPTHDGDKLVWTLGALDPGEAKQFQLVLTNSAEPGDTLRNEVEIYTLYDSNEDNNRAEAEAHVSDGQPDLYVNKQMDGSEPAPGQTFLYRIEYGNNGPVASGAVTLTDTLPGGTSVVSWYSENGYDLWSEVSDDGGQLVLQAPSIPGNWGDNIYLRLLLDGEVEIDTELINTVEIATEHDTDPDNNSSTHYANVREPYWDAGIDKNFGNGQLVPGGEIYYGLHFRNQGNMAANATVTDILPEGVILVEAWREWGPNNIPFPPDLISGRSITWDIGVMEPGEWYNLRLRLRIDTNVAPDIVLTNCAEIAIAEEDGNPENDRACVNDAVRSPGPNIRVSKRVSWSDEDRQLEYQINVENIGTVTLHQVTVTDTYPISTTFSGEWWHWFWEGLEFSQDDAKRQLVWTFERLEPDWSTGVAFRLELEDAIVGVQGLAFTNTVEAPIVGDVYPGDNMDTAIAYSGPDLFAEKWVSEGELLPGERITFTMRYGNANQEPWGMSDGTSARLTDRLPAGMTFVKALWPDGNDNPPFFQDPASGLIIWDEDRFGGSDRRLFYLVVDLDDALEPGDVLTNTIAITQIPALDIDPNPDNNTFAFTIKFPLIDLYLPMMLRR